MLEILIYLVASIGALFIAGYSVHMVVGGLVSVESENKIIFLVCAVVFCVIAYMFWDVVQRRTGRK